MEVVGNAWRHRGREEWRQVWMQGWMDRGAGLDGGMEVWRGRGTDKRIDGLMDGWRKADSASKVRLGTWQSTNSMTEEGMNQYMFFLIHLWCDTSIHNKYPTISNVRSQSWTHQYA